MRTYIHCTSIYCRGCVCLCVYTCIYIYIYIYIYMYTLICIDGIISLLHTYSTNTWTHPFKALSPSLYHIFPLSCSLSHTHLYIHRSWYLHMSERSMWLLWSRRRSSITATVSMNCACVRVHAFVLCVYVCATSDFAIETTILDNEIDQDLDDYFVCLCMCVYVCVHWGCASFCAPYVHIHMHKTCLSVCTNDIDNSTHACQTHSQDTNTDIPLFISVCVYIYV